MPKHRNRRNSDPFAAAKQKLIETARYLGARHYHAAFAGNLSTRVAEDRILCTCHGADKTALQLNDIIVCDLEGKKVSGEGSPTSEFSMHRMAYRERPEVEAVIHAHPPTATAFAAASLNLDTLMLPEMVVLLGPVALVPYATPGTDALAEQLRGYLQQHDSFLLENHGALTVGRDLRAAGMRMELLEHNAMISLALRQMGCAPFALSSTEMDALMRIRNKINQVSNEAPSSTVPEKA